jgi:hypothetical protein
MALLALAACKAPELPDAHGFEAGAVERGPSFVRRDYVHGAVHISVTRAPMPVTPAQFDEWSKGSASFPQAALGPSANGFYQCGEDPDNCDLLVQTRDGMHYELRAGGTAHRADLDALFAELRR